jgi:hypothetical protein
MPCSLPITSPLAVSSCWPCCGLFSEASGLFSRLQLDLNQGTPVQFALTFFLMISFMYRCPKTGQEVHGRVADQLIDGETYELVTCTACGSIHLINHKTGKLLEELRTASR